jgi:hypothetical protein
LLYSKDICIWTNIHPPVLFFCKETMAEDDVFDQTTALIIASTYKRQKILTKGKNFHKSLFLLSMNEDLPLRHGKYYAASQTRNYDQRQSI